MLHDVSKTKELRPGFVQAVYKKQGARAIVLLFDVKKGAELPRHSHPECQFGYTFFGDYDFVIDDANYPASAGKSYLIDGNVPHSAVALSDYYSLDFKYVTASPLVSSVSMQVVEPGADRDGRPLGEVRFDDVSGQTRVVQLADQIDYRLPSPPTAVLRERILVVSGETAVVINGKTCQAEAMNIYRLEAPGELHLKVAGSGAQAFLFEI